MRLRASQLTLPKGDLGHTDLQEDLEFHSSSTPSSSPSDPSATTRLTYFLRSLQHNILLPTRNRQDPTRLDLLPPRPNHILLLLQQPQTLPLDPLLLRASLRRRYCRSPAPLQIRNLPARKLPRRARRQPRSLRASMDRYNRRRHLIPHGND
jgi:hypothetical protein